MLETDRTRLTVLCPKDAADIRHYYLTNAAHLDPWEPARPPGFYTKASWAARGQQAQSGYAAGSSLRLVARLKTNGELVAACNFTHISRGPYQSSKLGFSIAKVHQGQGLMFEICETALNFAFHNMELHRVEASHLPDNTRSAALLSRLGFEREGLAKAYLKIAGRWCDHVMTAKLNPQPRP